MAAAGMCALPGFGNQGSRPEPELHVQGHSGCEVKLIRKDGLVFIEKSSQDSSYNSRLHKQIQKQKSYGDANRLPYVRIPRILEERETDGLVTARMEYVYFLDSLDYFTTASIVDVDLVVWMIVSYIDTEVRESEIVDVDPHIFLEKLKGIEIALESNGQIGSYQQHIRSLESTIRESGCIRLPVGRCHGDLTFSNIMIASDSGAIALIDFLDSFIESPIVDIAKVRQDSRFCWSLTMAARLGDPVRFRLVMQYIDTKVSEHYSGHDWYARNIDLILALNLLRIAPYAKRKDIHEFLLHSMSSLELRR
jgi:hypothetical protein